MKILGVIAVAAGLAVTAQAHAATRVQKKSTDRVDAEQALRKLRDHPLTSVLPNSEVKLEVTFDQVLRSCCAPPNLVVNGSVTNLSLQPIDYAKLLMTFRDASGKIVYTEDGYNHKAVSLGEDAMVAEILKEKPHFEPLPPGGKDSFTFEIPLPIVPRYQSAQLSVAEVVRESSAKIQASR